MNNYQKQKIILTIALLIFLNQFLLIITTLKKILQFNVNNKTTINNVRLFYFCRYCDNNCYNNVCFNRKIILTKIKNEKKKSIQLF